MKQTYYIQDAVDLYEQYLNKNKNIIDTLENLEYDEKLPYFFMNYFSTHADFLKYFNISENDFFIAKCKHWNGLDVFNIHKTIRTNQPISPINNAESYLNK